MTFEELYGLQGTDTGNPSTMSDYDPQYGEGDTLAGLLPLTLIRKGLVSVPGRTEKALIEQAALKRLQALESGKVVQRVGDASKTVNVTDPVPVLQHGGDLEKALQLAMQTHGDLTAGYNKLIPTSYVSPAAYDYIKKAPGYMSRDQLVADILGELADLRKSGQAISFEEQVAPIAARLREYIAKNGSSAPNEWSVGSDAVMRYRDLLANPDIPAHLKMTEIIAALGRGDLTESQILAGIQSTLLRPATDDWSFWGHMDKLLGGQRKYAAEGREVTPVFMPPGVALPEMGPARAERMSFLSATPDIHASSSLRQHQNLPGFSIQNGGQLSFDPRIVYAKNYEGQMVPYQVDPWGNQVSQDLTLSHLLTEGPFSGSFRDMLQRAGTQGVAISKNRYYGPGTRIMSLDEYGNIFGDHFNYRPLPRID